ncbi:NUDIX domain-containing protein [Nocardiopsis sp. EMB25]|uniref:NUDIX domain-containing protein n=1 Tax=Nocardiopsis sp. EMB25 TaxID=2835867 RepID=UPI0022846A3D|nr:NUDIX domain-containing protein [Nocardiopsis sp. EMB25]MCY9787938.1 NUDIX domain-containing protein [Nocardiopsis sp. EMB25]
MTTTNTTTAAKRCCGTSVGARVRRRTTTGWEYLLIGRGWWPLGQAPVAGHVRDAHTDVVAALLAEMAEETGLTVAGYRFLHEGYLPNLCASLPAQPRAGHYWWIYDATVTGTLTPDPEETTGAGWVDADRLQELADITICHAADARPARDLPPQALEAVWVEHLARTGDIQATTDERKIVARLYTVAPDAYWLGGRP